MMSAAHTERPQLPDQARGTLLAPCTTISYTESILHRALTCLKDQAAVMRVTSPAATTSVATAVRRARLNQQAKLPLDLAAAKWLEAHLLGKALVTRVRLSIATSRVIADVSSICTG